MVFKVGDNLLDIDIDFEDLGLDTASSNKQEPKKVKASQTKIRADISKPKKSKQTNTRTKVLSSDKKVQTIKKSKSGSRKLTDVFGSAAGSVEKKKFHAKPKNRKTLKSKPKSPNSVVEDIEVVRKKVAPIAVAESLLKLSDSGSSDSSKSSMLKTEKRSKSEPKLKSSGYNFGQLNHLCNLVRQDVLDMLYHAGSGHSAGSLDQAEIFVALYFKIMRHDPKDPAWSERDILVQSNGHTVPVRYAVMARAGYFPRHNLLNLRQFDSNLQGHPERERIPALETTSGPLGSGLSQAAGMALSLMMDSNKTRRIYCTMGDGELNEGNIWEAAMFANKYKLGNLIGIVDRLVFVEFEI